MNKWAVNIWLPFLFLQCSAVHQSSFTTGYEKHTVEKDKSFNEFFELFCASPRFQLSRIVFPLKDYYLEPGEDGIRDLLVEHEIDEEEWEYTNFKLDSLHQFTETDQYQIEIKQINKKHIEYIRNGVDNGIQVVYHFQKMEHKWYLTKIVDTSY